MAGKSIKDMIAAGAAVIDVRTPDEFADGAYPGAKNIPLQALPSRFGEIGPKDKPVVLYCASGSRSSAAMAFLKQNGYTEVVNAGGLDDMPS
jgi:phage shock protein E